MKGEASRLVDQFTRAHDGDPWHGSSLKEILKGVDHTLAARKPANGAHSIWELVVHITAWRNEVARRAMDQPAAEPAEGDYPDVGEPTAARWQAALDALDAAHGKLVTVVRGMTDDKLLEPTNDSRDRPLGTGVSYYELLHGIVQHDAYHAGQIAILKKR
ncbi:MAG TPA: DinB family protein [Vicinamibacterales bacterium]|nr:DinB family protein [Vicinamibacterales bacterium]